MGSTKDQRITTFFRCVLCSRIADQVNDHEAVCSHCNIRLPVLPMDCPKCDSADTGFTSPADDLKKAATVIGGAAKGLVARGVGAQFGAIGYGIGNEMAKGYKRAEPLTRSTDGQYHGWYQCFACGKQWAIYLSPANMTEEETAEHLRRAKKRNARNRLLVLLFGALLAAVIVAAVVQSATAK